MRCKKMNSYCLNNILIVIFEYNFSHVIITILASRRSAQQNTLFESRSFFLLSRLLSLSGIYSLQQIEQNMQDCRYTRVHIKRSFFPTSSSLFVALNYIPLFFIYFYFNKLGQQSGNGQPKSGVTRSSSEKKNQLACRALVLKFFRFYDRSHY